ncbi:MAG: PAS domain S-box protein [Steroidobacterales bacterium]
MNESNTPSSELQAVLDAAVDAIILIDHAGRIQVFNRAAERLFGHTEQQVLGRNVSMLMTERDRDQHDAYMERYLRTGVAHIIGIGREVQARRNDGSVFPAFLSIGRVAGSDPPRFVGFIHDITLRIQALAAVQRERDRANRYLETAQTMLVALDLDHRVTMVNRKGCEVLGHEEDALLGMDWFETVVPAEQRAKTAREFAALMQREPRLPFHYEYEVVTHSGARRLIAWRCVVVGDSPRTASGVLCSGDDVTDVRRAEADAREASERMMHVSRLATLGEMASGISHELNQPLSAIANYAQASSRLLSMDTIDLADVREAVEQITVQALRAGEIIRRLRSLVRNRTTDRQLASVNEVIEELGTLTRADARASDVRIVLELEPKLPRMNVDRIQIQQVLLNLLRNSLDALEVTPPGLREVVIRTRLDPTGEILITVADTGPGVPEYLLPRLFMPFATSKAQGTGLGLAISRTIVEAHGGRLDYQGDGRPGATFTVKLPAAQEADI